MFKSFISYLIVSYLLVKTVYLEEYAKNFRDIDLFQAINVNPYILASRFMLDYGRKRYLPVYEEKSEIGRLNDFLVDRTNSTDVAANLDILLEELIRDYKKNDPNISGSIEAKRLILALSTLKGDNKCNYYGCRIISNNYIAIDPDTDSIIANTNLRRIDKIFAYYIRDRMDNCRQVYFRKFDEIFKNANRDLIRRVDMFLGKAIEIFKSNHPQFSGENYAEGLFKVLTYKISSLFEINSSYLANAIELSAKHDPNVKFLRPVEDERVGGPRLDRDKFDPLFHKYVTEPCSYFRRTFGPDVFEPMMFDSDFDRRVEYGRADFYEYWYKYKLCHRSFNYDLRRVVEYINNSDDNLWFRRNSLHYFEA